MAGPVRRIAFYAPLKAPDDPAPSGDREIARLLVAALARAGYDVTLASRFSAYQKRPSPARFETLRQEGLQEAERIAATWTADPARRPDLFFTYHPYCKAPDWLGPHLSRRFSCPYVTAEACRTRQDTDADWQAGREAVGGAIRHASVNFCLKPSDRAYLETVLQGTDTIRDLKPFLDTAAMPAHAERAAQAGAVPVIVTAGMMREGKKLKCYRFLAEALSHVRERPWRLVVLGDGAARAAAREAFSGLDDGRITFAGAVPRAQVLGWFDRADLFAWPGWQEPIGMVYLEAAARGLPVAAFRSLGVPEIVIDGQTGLLAPEGDAEALGKSIARLLDDPVLRRRLGAAGKAKIVRDHDIAAASRTLRAGIETLFHG